MKNDHDDPESPLDRVQAQRRVDQIQAFRDELARLDQDAVLILSEDQRQRLRAHHDHLIQDFARQFDVDTSVSQKQLSWGMRIASFLGALALAASVFFFFYRIWGVIPTPVQVIILVSAPILTALLTEFAAKREIVPYFTTLIGLIAFACFVLNLSLLGDLFNLTPTQHALLVWGAFAFVLAYNHGLRLLLVAGILCLIGFLSATVGASRGIYWLSFWARPENFLPAGLLLFAFPSMVAHPKHPDFRVYYRVFGLLTMLIAILTLSHWGNGSYLMLPEDLIEAAYQLLGFSLSGVAIWLGIRQHWPGVTHLGTTFFVIQLYTKFFEWWWEWMPKYIFFLLLGLIAVGLLFGIQRLRTLLKEVPA